MFYYLLPQFVVIPISYNSGTIFIYYILIFISFYYSVIFILSTFFLTKQFTQADVLYIFDL